MNEDIRDSIKIIRNVLNYTQEEFSDILGISRPTLVKLEQGSIKLQKTVGVAYVAIILLKYEKLEWNSKQHKIIKVYVEDFKKILSDLI